jgi:hypothetical protein
LRGRPLDEPDGNKIAVPYIIYSILLDPKKKENFCFSQASFCFGCQSSKRLLTWLTLPLVTRRSSLIVAILLAIVSKRRERATPFHPHPVLLAGRQVVLYFLFFKMRFLLASMSCLFTRLESFGRRQYDIHYIARLVWWDVECMRGRCF